MRKFNFIFKGNIFFGSGSRFKINDIIRDNNYKSICIVIDHALLSVPLINEFIQSIDCNKVVVECDISEPTYEKLEEKRIFPEDSSLDVFIGIGGGSFSVPALSMFSKKIHEAVGTSAVFGFFIAFPGVIIFMITGSFNENIPNYSIGYLNYIIVLLVSSTSVFTANIGAKISSKINKITLKRIFATFLLFTCLSLIIEHFII